MRMLDPPDAEIRLTARLIQDVRAMVRSWTDAETGVIPDVQPVWRTWPRLWSGT